MFKKILVPLDGSDFAESVMTHVRMIAESCKAPQVVLLMVMEPFNPEAYIVPENILEEAHKRALVQAKRYLEGLAVQLAQIQVSASCEVVEGKTSEAILAFAQKNAIDMIVMSTHGRTGITRWALGSNADRVVRRSPVPILMVAPPGSRRTEPD